MGGDWMILGNIFNCSFQKVTFLHRSIGSPFQTLVIVSPLPRWSRIELLRTLLSKRWHGAHCAKCSFSETMIFFLAFYVTLLVLLLLPLYVFCLWSGISVRQNNKNRQNASPTASIWSLCHCCSIYLLVAQVGKYIFLTDCVLWCIDGKELN